MLNRINTLNHISFLLAIALLFSIVSCGSTSSKKKEAKPKPNRQLSLSAEELDHLQYLQKPFDKNEVAIFDKKGVVTRLAAANCKVYKSVKKDNIVIRWEVVLSPNLFYPSYTRCVRNQIFVNKEKYIEVSLGKKAFGAGGCCAVSGTYRTLNGVDWEEKTARNKWERKQ